MCDPVFIDGLKTKLRDDMDADDRLDAVVHLAAIVGFPACQAVGQQVAWRYNVDSVRLVFQLAEEIGSQRFIFSSTCTATTGSPLTVRLSRKILRSTRSRSTRKRRSQQSNTCWRWQRRQPAPR